MHAHLITFLDNENKFSLQHPTTINNLILAEIAPVTCLHLRELALEHMIHAPCSGNADFRCRRDGRCSKTFPKPFRSEIASVEGDYYVSYRR